MNTHITDGSILRGVWLARRFLAVCLGVLVVSMAMMTPVSRAQESTPGGDAPQARGNDDLAGVPGVEPGMTVDQLIDVAVTAIQSRRLEEAERILSVVVARNKEHIRGLQTLGYVYELRAAAARADSTNPNAQQQAETLVNNAVRTYLYAAPLAVSKGRMVVAEQMYKAVLGQRPNDPDALIGMARVLAEKGSLQAVERYKAYLKTPRGERDSEAYLELGRVYRDNKYLHLAVTTLLKAKSLNPESPDILIELARAYLDSNRNEEAIGLARSAALEKAPSNPAYRNLYAQILLRMGQSPGGMPSPAQRAQLEANIEEARNQARESIRLGRTALVATPEDIKTVRALNRYFDTYRQILATLVKNGREEADIRLELASVSREQAVLTSMSSAYESMRVIETLEVPSERAVAHMQLRAQLQFDIYLAQMSLGIENLAPVVETCRQLLELAPGNPVAERIMKHLPAGSIAPATQPAVAPKP